MPEKLKIAILGTRGIPNSYGGFEQFAEYLSTGLVKRGHEVTVYNPHLHGFSENDYKGVRIIQKYSPESHMGSAANFVYDFLCLRDALKQNFDIILECGYGTASVSYYLCPIHRSIVITNMDGLEWKRTKWSKPVKRLMKLFEKWGAKKSHALVADNKGIQKHLQSEYGKDSTVIPYGANVFDNPDVEVLKEFDVDKNDYFLLVARLEPENNIEMILNGYSKSDSKKPFLVIGNHETGYGELLKETFPNNRIRFLGSIYDDKTVNNLRYYSSAYFHGHSVGGTNPSLLEAMACSCLIIAHDNIFNNRVLNGNAFFFSDEEEVKKHIHKVSTYNGKRKEIVNRNLDRIRTKYSWDKIIDQYEKLFFDHTE